MGKSKEREEEQATTAAVPTPPEPAGETPADTEVVRVTGGTKDTVIVTVDVEQLLAKKFPHGAPVPIVYDGSRGPRIGMAKANGEPTRYFAAHVPQLIDYRELAVHLLMSKKGFAIAETIDKNAKQ